MWNNLPNEQKREYKKMILAFASLTEMFAQKASDAGDEKHHWSPVVNSKYQETVFQKAFNAVAEDIGNTSYDVSLKCDTGEGGENKYLIGIKTFGFSSGPQKIAQFKRNSDEWTELISRISENSFDSKGQRKTKAEIDVANHDLYLSLAKKIATIRNARIASSISNLQGFTVSEDDKNVQSVYHVLMTSAKDDKERISV